MMGELKDLCGRGRTCNTCIFWEHFGNAAYGQCRACLPTMYLTRSEPTHGLWPVTQPTQWCAYYRPPKAGQATPPTQAQAKQPAKEPSPAPAPAKEPTPAPAPAQAQEKQPPPAPASSE